MYGYIYLTENLFNGKRYIGQHKGEFDSTYLEVKKVSNKSGGFITSPLEVQNINGTPVCRASESIPTISGNLSLSSSSLGLLYVKRSKSVEFITAVNFLF